MTCPWCIQKMESLKDKLFICRNEECKLFGDALTPDAITSIEVFLIDNDMED